jgi:hypothetical protein
MSATTAQETCLVLREVTDVLTRLGDALVGADLDALLAAEPLLEDLSRTLTDVTRRAASASSTRGDGASAPLAVELKAARLALLRAAHLGTGVYLFKAASDAAHGVVAYDRDGRSNRPGPSSALSTRG